MKLEEEYQISVTGPYHTERGVCFLVECSKKGADGDLVRDSAFTLWLPSSFALRTKAELEKFLLDTVKEVKPPEMPENRLRGMIQCIAEGIHANLGGK